ncbi:hypothetical protein CEUSTIGMA_g8394.t1 [Chlamydomonas eustigma]|uniref:YchJ-like middle NTF2-like domain-containing protein n=1 Tax=Chlamydomonas eustigma TaxID=1157962 RepID=A0A250XDG8_9CHLO|nr:hypothetical protein CEUSTIGMA_g8394.t1 [Chlamydomonas eustigma]|eukprot:GAX80959.1 hypothetical protein CEUSTIGMA_g8394.t1 [Chlamydomonas eustigma]
MIPSTFSSSNTAKTSCCRPRNLASVQYTQKHEFTFRIISKNRLSFSFDVRRKYGNGVTSATKGFGAPPKTLKVFEPENPCPCGSGQTYKGCCNQYHSGATPSTPELLLRSRYSAYFIKNAEYIADTTHPESEEFTGSRASYISAVKATQRRMDLRSLEVKKIEEGRAPQEAFIDFKMTFMDRGSKNPSLITRNERSRFLCVGGKWMFIDSDFEQT